MIRETAYNEIFDSQLHFRTLLDSMSRPGKINRFHSVEIAPPAGLARSAAYVGFALLNADVSFHAAGFGEREENYFKANTHSRIDTPERADFIFLRGSDECVAIDAAKVGIPTYPEGGATAVILIDRAGRSSSIGGLQLTLEGPGIESREIVYVSGLRIDHLAALRIKNQEFPLGVDAILATSDECVLCLPRTTRVSWNVA